VVVLAKWEFYHETKKKKKVKVLVFDLAWYIFQNVTVFQISCNSTGKGKQK